MGCQPLGRRPINGFEKQLSGWERSWQISWMGKRDMHVFPQ